MKFDYKAFHIDILVRHDGDQHIGRFHIYRGPSADHAAGYTHESGDLQRFDAEADAIVHAQQHAIAWINCNAG
jgi:hypothetical protein